MILPSFTYEYLSGPLETPEECTKPLSTGNCRRAVQAYLYLNHGCWLRPDQVLCPALYRLTGHFVENDLSSCLEGDVLLAERIRNKDGSIVDRTRASYATEDEWILYMHSAMVVEPRSEKIDARIWHATSIAGGTCEWSGREFGQYYRIVAVKRVIEAPSEVILEKEKPIHET